MKKLLSLCTLAFAASLILSCSSAPKRAMQVTSVYTSANSLLETSNSCIATGDLTSATSFLTNAYNQAMSIDNADLLTAICITRISLELSYNPPNIETANEYLELAEAFEKNAVNKAKLTPQCILAKIRIALAAGNSDEDLLKLLGKCEPAKGDKYTEAQIKSTRGDVLKMYQDYTNAVTEYEGAAKLYTDNRYLYEIGITWYKAAQCYSLSGKKQNALEALEKAIFYDRAAENSKALGSDYYAKGLILSKGNPSSGDLEKAKTAFTHSAEIFTAAGFEELAQRSKQAAE